MPRVPYPTTKGIQMVRDEMSSRNPKAKSLQPGSFIRCGKFARARAERLYQEFVW
jgi:hypothetical protein